MLLHHSETIKYFIKNAFALDCWEALCGEATRPKQPHSYICMPVVRGPPFHYPVAADAVTAARRWMGRNQEEKRKTSLFNTRLRYRCPL